MVRLGTVDDVFQVLQAIRQVLHWYGSRSAVEVRCIHSGESVNNVGELAGWRSTGEVHLGATQ